MLVAGLPFPESRDRRDRAGTRSRPPPRWHQSAITAPLQPCHRTAPALPPHRSSPATAPLQPGHRTAPASAGVPVRDPEAVPGSPEDV